MKLLDENTNVRLSLIIAVSGAILGAIFSYAYTMATYGQQLKQIERWMEEKDKRDVAITEKISAMREDIVAIKAILEKRVAITSPMYGISLVQKGETVLEEVNRTIQAN